MSAMLPPPLERTKIIKSRLLSPFFIHLPIEPECFEMAKFYKKTGWGRPLRQFYGSPDYKNTNLHNRKMFLTKELFRAWWICFIFCFKKVDLFSGRGRAPPPSFCRPPLFSLNKGLQLFHIYSPIREKAVRDTVYT